MISQKPYIVLKKKKTVYPPNKEKKLSKPWESQCVQLNSHHFFVIAFQRETSALIDLYAEIHEEFDLQITQLSSNKGIIFVKEYIYVF